MLISTVDGLCHLCRMLDQRAFVALDAEFASERRYYPRFDLLQVATADLAAVVDPGAIKDLGPLMDRLADPERTVVLHAGFHDLAILHHHTGRLPARVFDTQVAAAMVGYGAQVSYAVLVKWVTGTELTKRECLSDWSQRPLRSEQIHYALDDVRYLLPVQEHLATRLESLGRTAWFAEECSRQLDPKRFAPPDVRARWHRQGARAGLNPRQIAVLEELAAWREQRAQDANCPPRYIIPDEVLPHLARRQPSALGELRETRQILDRAAREHGAGIIEAIRKGLAQRDLHHEPPAPPYREPPGGVVELLDTVVRARAQEQSLAPALLGTRAETEQLVQDLLAGRPSEVPLMTGWRRELAGNDVLRVWSGDARVSRDTATGLVRIEPSR